MDEKIQKLKEWIDKVYDQELTVACLEVPILKILSQKENDWITRDDLINKLLQYGDFKRSELSFDHLWSQRFGKGEEHKVLNDLVEHDAENPGEKKVKYKIKDDINKEILRNVLGAYNEDTIEELISKRLEYVKKNKEKKQGGRNTSQPLNQILYGPPGTGKTYNTINKALEIIAKRDEVLKTFLQSNPTRIELKQRFDKYKTDDQIKFITFHQSYAYEEFIEGIKPQTKKCDELSDNNDISYCIKDGIFKEIVQKAKKNYENTLKNEDELSKEEEFYKKLEILKDIVEEKIEEQGYFPLENTIVYIDNITNNSFRYRSDNWKNSISMSFDDLKKLYLFNVEERKEIKKLDNITETARQHASYFIRVLKKLYNIKVENITTEKEALKNYILIIDEINRGNISKIFGELITLIEDSKRLGADEQMSATLPYSNEEFTVPNNLYIIGTMNTADRSIAHIDTALRRRFEFIEMMPKTSEKDKELNFEVEQINIRALLKSINDRIEVLYDREHTIGHSYFMSLNLDSKITDFANIFEKKIIPLLAEYFYSDWNNIKLVLNDFSQTDDTNGNNGQELIVKKKIPKSIENHQKNKPIFELNYDALKEKSTYLRMIEHND